MSQPMKNQQLLDVKDHPHLKKSMDGAKPVLNVDQTNLEMYKRSKAKARNNQSRLEELEKKAQEVSEKLTSVDMKIDIAINMLRSMIKENSE